MIVVDASITVEYLLGTPAGEALRRLRPASPGAIHAPALLDVEVANALKRLARGGLFSEERCESATRMLRDLPIRRWDHRALLERVWQLRGSLSAYDAAYVVLAERLGARLLTRDGRLAGTPGHRADVVVV